MKPPEGSAALRQIRKRLFAHAFSLVKDGGTDESWKRHVEQKLAALAAIVGEEELGHIWAVAQAEFIEEKEHDEDP